MNTKLSSILFLGGCFIPLIVYLCLIYIYDPLSVFHPPYSREFTVAVHASRQQNIAFVKHFSFDSFIMGNSLTANTSCKDAEDTFGGNFLNLSMDGASLYEQSIVRDYVLKNKNIKTVFSVFSPSLSKKGHGGYAVEQWDYLYDSSSANDIKVYVNIHYLRCLLRWSQSTQCVGEARDMDRPTAWYEMPDHYIRFGGIDKWLESSEHHQLIDIIHRDIPQYAALPLQQPLPLPDAEVIAISDMISEYIITPAIQNPETQFVYFFSPHFIMHRAFGVRDSSLDGYCYWIEESIRLSAGVSNIHIFGFDNEEFTDDIAYFKDLNHYRPEMNKMILEKIKVGDNLLTTENVNMYTNLLRERAEQYDLASMNEYVQKNIGKYDGGKK